jgi:hypothetical protein
MRLLLLAVGVGLVLVHGPLSASTFLTPEFREIVSDSATVVRGRVTDVRAIRSAAGEVESVVTIAVDAVLKGPAETFVSMRVPGGVIGRYRTVMTGAPVMRVNDYAIFVLKRGPGNPLRPVGLSQGIYRVSASATGAVVGAPVLPGVTTNATGPVVRGDARRKALPVSEFDSLVRLVVAGSTR